MSRTADYTIEGFLYQFHRTILAILDTDEESTITVEGVIEDIDVSTPTGITAIQCKYHESTTTFQPSSVYKPLLQMLQHFCVNPDGNIKYVLFAHFPDPPSQIGVPECEAALKSTNKNLQKYISEIDPEIELEKFIDRFQFEYGSRYDDLILEVQNALKSNGIPEDSIEILAYPNAINIVADLSRKHNENERKITKKKFLEALKGIRKTAITLWTMSLKTKDKLLAAKRKQLKTRFDANKCRRYFIINKNDKIVQEDYEDQIVKFAREYCNKYHYKTAHSETPLICIVGDREEIKEIQGRLYSQQLIAEDGYIGGRFEESRFFREPRRGKAIQGVSDPEFHFRIISWHDHQENGNLLNKQKGQYLFIIGELELDSLDLQDVEVEHLSGMNLKEFKYVIRLSESYE